MKTSRQRKRRSAPGDVAPPGQQYSDRECIRWLLEFLRCDLAALRPGELLALRNEVFPYLHYKSRATLTVFDEDELLALGPVPPRRPGVDSRHVIAAAREFMGGVQDDLRAGVNALQAGMWQPFGLQGPAPSWSFERGDDGRSCVPTWGTGAPSQSRQPQTCWCDGGRNSGAANTRRAACGFCRRTGVSGITTPGVRRRPGINDSSRRGTTKPNTCADTTAHARPLGTTHQEGGRGADTRAVPWTGALVDGGVLLPARSVSGASGCMAPLNLNGTWRAVDHRGLRG